MKNLFYSLTIKTLFLVIIIAFNSCGQQNQNNQEAEKEAIKQVIRDQTRLLIEGDFENYKQVWAHKPYAERLLTNGRTLGWDKVSERYKNLFENNPEWTSLDQREFTDFNFRIYDKSALVSNAQKHNGRPAQYNIRLFEKEAGDWKIVYHNTIPYAGPVSTISGSELWNEVINYHDPEGNWEDFTGKVQIITTFENGNQGSEILEVRKPDNFYAESWTLLVDPESFALLGMHTDLDIQGETIDYLTIFEGELNVDGIIMPQSKTGYRNGEFWHNDTFTLSTMQWSQ